jgi:DNA end-binding protein Ku
MSQISIEHVRLTVDRPFEAFREAFEGQLGRFDPSAYTDEVRGRVEAAIDKKVQGQEITMVQAPEPGAQVIDLMEALRASLEKKPAKRAQAAAQPAKPARKAAAKK